jgi:hypothetical protein
LGLLGEFTRRSLGLSRCVLKLKAALRDCFRGKHLHLSTGTAK